MPSIYDVLAESCARLAARTGRHSDKVRLLQLANQWRTIPAESHGPGKKPAVPTDPSGIVNPVRSFAPTPKSPREMPKLATHEIASDPKRGEGRRPRRSAPCPICNFQTDPPHDGRSHRGQTKKKPLSAEELEQKGLTKVSP